MTKVALIEKVAKATMMNKSQARRAVDAVAEAICDAVAGEGRFAFPGVGVFRKVFQKPRTITPGFGKSGTTIDRPGQYTVKFKPNPFFKAAVQK